MPAGEGARAKRYRATGGGLQGNGLFIRLTRSYLRSKHQQVTKAAEFMARTPLETALLAKLRSLPPERITEVEDFIEFLRLKEKERQLQRAVSGTSEAAFEKVWDSPDDAEY